MGVGDSAGSAAADEAPTRVSAPTDRITDSIKAGGKDLPISCTCSGIRYDEIRTDGARSSAAVRSWLGLDRTGINERNDRCSKHGQPQRHHRIPPAAAPQGGADMTMRELRRFFGGEAERRCRAGFRNIAGVSGVLSERPCNTTDAAAGVGNRYAAQYLSVIGVNTSQWRHPHAPKAADCRQEVARRRKLPTISRQIPVRRGRHSGPHRAATSAMRAANVRKKN